MRRLGRAAGGAALIVAAVLLSAESPAPPPGGDLPVLGTELGALPDGPMKPLADAACLHCHSADMIRQQRLTERQWTAEVTKMVGWGAAVPEDRKAALVAYLLEHFGPDNDRFHPVAAQPLGR